MDTAFDIIYPNIRRQKTNIYDPTFQGKQCKDYSGSVLINCRDTKSIKKDKIEHIIGVNMFHIYILKEGFKCFWGKGGNGVISEIYQLHEMEIFIPFDATQHTRKDKSESLVYLMLLP